MTIQILPGNSIGSNLGQALGSGIQQALQGLVQQKIQQKYRMQAVPGLEGLGFSPEQAQSIALLDPQIQREVVKQRMAAPQQEAYAQALQGLLGEGQQMPQFGAPAMQQFSGQAPQLQLGQQMGMMPQTMQQQSPEFKLPPRLTQQQATELAKLQLQKHAQQEKQRQFETKLSAQEQRETNKEVRPVLRKLINEGKAAKENDMRLERMNKLIDSGKLDFPIFNSALKAFGKLGFDLTGAFLSTESQEFDKLSKDFLKNIKDVFGAGKVTNLEVENYLKTIPNLTQSDEGKKAVIRNLQIFNKGTQLKSEAARQLAKQYGNKLPIDFEEQVEDMVKPELDKLSEEFKEGLKDSEMVATKAPEGVLENLSGTIPGKRELKAAVGVAGLPATLLGGSWLAKIGLNKLTSILGKKLLGDIASGAKTVADLTPDKRLALARAAAAAAKGNSRSGILQSISSMGLPWALTNPITLGLGLGGLLGSAHAQHSNEVTQGTPITPLGLLGLGESNLL